jgi:hypothetical protein
MIRIHLKTTVTSENLGETQEAAKVEYGELDEMISGNFKVMEHKKLEKSLKN